MSMTSTAWVIDTSSLIALHRRSNISSDKQQKIFENLSKLVEDEQLYFPKQIVKELERQEGKEDPVYLWAKKNEVKACSMTPTLDSPHIQAVLNHPQVSTVIDTEKVTDSDEADPYILAMALALRDSKRFRLVTVITQETKDMPNKLSLNSACGLLELVSLPILPFLRQQSLIS